MISRRRTSAAVQRDREALSQAIESAHDELRELGTPAPIDCPEWDASLRALADAERVLAQLDARVRRPRGRRLAVRRQPNRMVLESP